MGRVSVVETERLQQEYGEMSNRFLELAKEARGVSTVFHFMGYACRANLVSEVLSENGQYSPEATRMVAGQLRSDAGLLTETDKKRHDQEIKLRERAAQDLLKSLVGS